MSKLQNKKAQERIALFEEDPFEDGD